MPFSPDQLRPESPLSPEEKTNIVKRIMKDIQKTITPYESLYVPSDELASFQTTPFDKQRFTRFQAWIRRLSERRSLPTSWKMSQMQLETAVVRVEKLYQAMFDVMTDRPLPAELHKRYFERPLAPDEFLLDMKNLPTWTEFPSERDFKTSFAFDEIWRQEYRQGRMLEEFAFTERDLLRVGYPTNDAEKRRAFLNSLDTSTFPKTLPPARIFDIGGLIREKIKRNGNSSDSLSTGELFKAFEEAGVRPATLPELLAYARTNWKPNRDPKKPLTPVEQAQHADAHYVYAFGSAFSRSDGARRIPCLTWSRNMRQLDAGGLDLYWSADNRFLVFRQESS